MLWAFESALEPWTASAAPIEAAAAEYKKQNNEKDGKIGIAHNCE